MLFSSLDLVHYQQNAWFLGVLAEALVLFHDAQLRGLCIGWSGLLTPVLLGE